MYIPVAFIALGSYSNANEPFIDNGAIKAERDENLPHYNSKHSSISATDFYSTEYLQNQLPSCFYKLDFHVKALVYYEEIRSSITGNFY